MLKRIASLVEDVGYRQEADYIFSLGMLNPWESDNNKDSHPMTELSTSPKNKISPFFAKFM